MDTVKVKIDSEEQASRLELLIRFVWCAVAGLILNIVGLVAFCALVVQWFYILVFGKRHMGIANFVNAYLVAYTGLYAYMYLSTEERPPLVPQF
ncbi:MAG: DUF4389 domain-containing protein [Candidatus ainarchaeum sp.]|nr:DUF4389 domain-containing protein [Candidatus ainarchaeum sp.]